MLSKVKLWSKCINYGSVWKKVNNVCLSKIIISDVRIKFSFKVLLLSNCNITSINLIRMKRIKFHYGFNRINILLTFSIDPPMVPLIHLSNLLQIDGKQFRPSSNRYFRTVRIHDLRALIRENVKFFIHRKGVDCLKPFKHHW